MEKEGTGGPPPETEEPPFIVLRPQLSPYIPGTPKPAAGALTAGGSLNLPRSAPAAGAGAKIPAASEEFEPSSAAVPEAGTLQGLGKTRAIIPEGAFGSITHSEGVTIKVSGTSSRDRGVSYEQGIRDTFGSGLPEGTYFQKIKTFVDDFFEGKIFESKHADVYMTSIYNPELSSESWRRPALDAVISQARKITSIHEGGAIYFTNDRSLAEDYKRTFEENGISRFRFVVVPSEK